MILLFCKKVNYTMSNNVNILWNPVFVNNKDGSKLDKIIEYYFASLEKDIVNYNLNREGLTGYLIAISEFYTFFIDKEKWLKYSYIVALSLRVSAIQDIKYENYNFIGGLLDIGFSIKLANKKIGQYTNFKKDIDNIIFNNLDRHISNIENCKSNPKVLDYDLVSGITGIGKYLLFDYRENEYLDLIRIIGEYIIFLTEDKPYKNIKVPRWCISNFNQLRNIDRVRFPKGSIDLGMAHGIIAPLLLLVEMKNRGIQINNLSKAIQKIIKIYDNLKRKKQNGIYSWNSQLGIDFFNNEFLPRDIRGNRQSWCYGDINISYSLLKIGIELGDKSIAEKHLNNIIEISKLDIDEYKLFSPIVCHGYAGLFKILFETYLISKNRYIKDRILKVLTILINDFKPTNNYGFINKGVAKMGTDIKEVECFDILNGATGVILSLLSLTNASTDWEYQFNL